MALIVSAPTRITFSMVHGAPGLGQFGQRSAKVFLAVNAGSARMLPLATAADSVATHSRVILIIYVGDLGYEKEHGADLRRNQRIQSFAALKRHDLRGTRPVPRLRRYSFRRPRPTPAAPEPALPHQRLGRGTADLRAGRQSVGACPSAASPGPASFPFAPSSPLIPARAATPRRHAFPRHALPSSAPHGPTLRSAALLRGGIVRSSTPVRPGTTRSTMSCGGGLGSVLFRTANSGSAVPRCGVLAAAHLTEVGRRGG